MAVLGLLSPCSALLQRGILILVEESKSLSIYTVWVL